MNVNPVTWSDPYPGPIQSIDTGADRQWKYSPDFAQCAGEYHGAWEISLTGRRIDDYVLAEDDGGEEHTPRVTVWHHLFNYNPADGQCTMQLVNFRYHQEACPHLGGCWQYRQHHGGRYRAIRENAKAGDLWFEGSYSDGDLLAFEKEFSLALSPLLKAVYSGKRGLPAVWREKDGRKESVEWEVIVPLWAKDGNPDAATAELMIDPENRLLPTMTTKKGCWLPFGLDGCGNWLAQDLASGAIHFFDHESEDEVVLDPVDGKA